MRPLKVVSKLFAVAALVLSVCGVISASDELGRLGKSCEVNLLEGFGASIGLNIKVKDSQCESKVASARIYLLLLSSISLISISSILSD
jgi:hypothetical protein